ncbi:MAG: glycoside hydrolase family 2 TIM barrel-domain containing protein [Planctomycetota bacterium]
MPPVSLLFVLFPAPSFAPEPFPQAANLAREATASAIESYGELTPEKANDGDPATRWSGIPGHNRGIWLELAWREPVRIGEVVLHQYDTFTMELDFAIWDEAAGEWRILAHRGTDGRRLPRVVLARWTPVETTRLRIANITNGPSFDEVEVYASAPPEHLALSAAGDLAGGIVGVVTDPWGSAPVAGATIELRGRAARGDWKAAATSDEHGLFRVAMPIGLAGTVEARVARPGAAGEAPRAFSLDPAALPPGLTPLGGATADTDLAGPWRFAVDPPEEFWVPGFDDSAWAAVEVPAHWEMLGFRSAAGIGGYRTRFAPPPGPGRLKLRFEGVYSGAEVWVNGERLAYHEGGATPFEMDVTATADRAENVLALRVAEHTRASDELDRMSQYADFPLAGILRRVHLFRVPDAHIGELAVATRFGEGYADAHLHVRAAVRNESAAPLRDAAFRFQILDPEGRAVPIAAAPAAVTAGPWERAEAETVLHVPAPRKWDAEHPHLHRLIVELVAGRTTLHRLEERIGFRQTEVRGPLLLVNGRPVKLRGTCHHDSHPLLGRAVTEDLTRLDVQMMKEANLNAVRTSHYPPHPALLDLADAEGLYVEDEAPFCWVGASDDLTLAPRILQLTAEMVARDRNHPSVFMWSLCNESGFGAGFERSHEWVRRVDPDRPTGAATSAWLEIATLHNPLAISRIEENEGLDRPLLFDESLCIFQGIFGDVAELWTDPGLRDYYAAPQPAIYARFMASRATQGSFIWCWSDDIFCVPNRGLEYGRGATRAHYLTEQYALPGRGLCGDAPWGVVDGWRRPKPEFWITKKLHSPVKVPEAPLPLPAAGAPLRVPVENQYDFTDLAELRVTWRIGAEAGEARAAVPPRASGEVLVRPARAPEDGDVLELAFTHPSGRLVDAYRLPIGAAAEPAPDFAALMEAPLDVRGESRLAGTAVHVRGGGFELAVDEGSGLLRRGVAAGVPLLLELPTLHVLPTARPRAPLPDLLSWRLEEMRATREGDEVRIVVRGAYEHFTGGYEYRITPAGEVTARAEFVYDGEDFWAREIGLRFSLPRTADLLQWERPAEWSVYPPDHIGRPRGQVRAFPAHGADLPPSWPWAEDLSPMGSNDFRSTKRNVHWASIGHPDGPAALVLGGGAQSVRAALSTDRLDLHVNDWYGGTNAGWWEWEHNYGKGKLLAKGERIAASVRLRLVARVASTGEE